MDNERLIKSLEAGVHLEQDELTASPVERGVKLHDNKKQPYTCPTCNWKETCEDIFEAKRLHWESCDEQGFWCGGIIEEVAT
jgi:hypothetical protein